MITRIVSVNNKDNVTKTINIKEELRKSLKGRDECNRRQEHITNKTVNPGNRMISIKILLATRMLKL